VKVVKDTRLKGQLATVIDPCWKDLVKVEMLEEDAKGRIKSFTEEELELAEEDGLEPQDGDDLFIQEEELDGDLPMAHALTTPAPTSTKVRGTALPVLARPGSRNNGARSSTPSTRASSRTESRASASRSSPQPWPPDAPPDYARPKRAAGSGGWHRKTTGRTVLNFERTR